MNDKPTQARLRELFWYDAASGLFIRRVTISSRAKAGAIAGSDVKGHVAIGVDGARYYAHVLAWVYMTGTWPDHEIDHKNRRKADNRWRNLRRASRNQQRWNEGGPRGGSTGVRGVYRSAGGRYRSYIGHLGKKVYLGCFDTAEEAARARKAAGSRLHGAFAGTMQ